MTFCFTRIALTCNDQSYPTTCKFASALAAPWMNLEDHPNLWLSLGMVPRSY